MIEMELRFTPHLVKPRSSPAFLRLPRFAAQARGETGRAEKPNKGAPEYLPRTFDKVRGSTSPSSPLLYLLKMALTIHFFYLIFKTMVF
jgi:hypothetical protein